MALSMRVPRKHLAFILLLMTFQGLAFGADTVGGAHLAEPLDTPDGFGITEVVNFVLSVWEKQFFLAVFFLELATFSAVSGIPAWVQLPLVGYFAVIWGLTGLVLMLEVLEVLNDLVPFT